MISYGADTDDATTPYELGMDNSSMLIRKRIFGKAALRSLRKAGVKRRFMGLLIDGEPFPAFNEARWELHQMATMSVWVGGGLLSTGAVKHRCFNGFDDCN